VREVFHIHGILMDTEAGLKIVRLFEAIDQDSSGVITKDELEHALRRSSLLQQAASARRQADEEERRAEEEATAEARRKAAEEAARARAKAVTPPKPEAKNAFLATKEALKQKEIERAESAKRAEDEEIVAVKKCGDGGQGAVHELPEENEDCLVLRFALPFAGLDHEKAKLDLLDNFRCLGGQEAHLERLKVDFREGSTIAEVRGPLSHIAGLRALPLENMKLLGREVIPPEYAVVVMPNKEPTSPHLLMQKDDAQMPTSDKFDPYIEEVFNALDRQRDGSVRKVELYHAMNVDPFVREAFGLKGGRQLQVSDHRFE
jgi:hypothetical protein